MLCGCSYFSFFESLIRFLHDVQTIGSGFRDSFVVAGLNLFVQVLALTTISGSLVGKLRLNCLPLKLF